MGEGRRERQQVLDGCAAALEWERAHASGSILKRAGTAAKLLMLSCAIVAC